MYKNQNLGEKHATMQESNKTRFELLYYDPVCQTGLEFNRTMRANANKESQESKMRDYMNKNKMYFMIHSEMPCSKTHENITPQKRQSSKIVANFVTPAREEISK